MPAVGGGAGRESECPARLGHVWTVQHTDAAARETFLAVRGLDVWNGEGVDRDHLGTEHAAEILAWALLDERTWAARLPDDDCEDLTAQ